MRMLILFLVLALAGCGPGGASYADSPKSVAVAGDSITWRTGQCQALEGCDASGSWATYLLQASGGSKRVILNAGRGGDTCTDQVPYSAGPFVGQRRGLINRVQQIIDAKPDQAIVLIGVNDVSVYGVQPLQVAACVATVRAQLQAAGVVVFVLTYPPIVGTSPVFGLTDADARVRALNAALIQGGAVDTSTAWPDWAAPYMTTDGVHPNASGAVNLALQVARDK